MARSVFAEALAGLLDQTGLFDRSEWARFFGVTPDTLDLWVRDQTLPRSDLLLLLLSVLADTADVPPDPIAAFWAIADRPATEVSPLGAKMGRSVSWYMNQSGFEQVARVLREGSEAEGRAILDGSVLP